MGNWLSSEETQFPGTVFAELPPLDPQEKPPFFGDLQETSPISDTQLIDIESLIMEDMSSWLRTSLLEEEDMSSASPEPECEPMMADEVPNNLPDHSIPEFFAPQ